MKPFQALGRVLLLVFLVLLLSDGTQCRPTQVPVINSKEEVFSVQHSGSNAKSEVTPKNSRPIKGALRSEESITQHLEGKRIKVVDASSQGHQQSETSAEARQRKVNPTERLHIEIIERPKELKINLKKAPMKKQSSKGEDMNKLKQLGEVINKAKVKSTAGAPLNEDRHAENEIYGDDDDDDDEISGSGQEESGDPFDFPDTGYKESFVSRDQAQHQHRAGKDEHGHQKKKKNHSRTANRNEAGILLLLVVTVFVLGVVSIVFLRRWCCRGNDYSNAELESVKMKRLASQQAALKEARIKVGKRKSQENRKVLKRLSSDQRASTVKEELAIARSIISPTIETRKKNSGALHTRSSIRAATSHSRRNSSFEEDLQQACCEFKNAPVRFAKLVSLAGDQKEMKTTQGSNNEAITTSDSPERDSDLQ